ncbi:MAG TPA: hypothetical protein VF590_18420 [Isosphaeraceae bacterium]
MFLVAVCDAHCLLGVARLENPPMTRSRYKIGETTFPYFLTGTVVA